MTTFLAAYDTENPLCIETLPRIVEVHEQHQVPATFFIVARLAESHAGAFRRLIVGKPWFEIASHSWTHMLLREHRLCGKPGPAEQFPHEIVDSKRHIEELFGCKVTGFRPPVCFEKGFHGAPHLLELVRRAGYAYISSIGWGPHDSLPIMPQAAFTYAEDGYPDIWEIPPCGWHENLLKGNNRWDPRPIQLFPHPFPEAAITDFVKTPEEEFQVHAKFIDRAKRDGLGHVSVLWHPWSLNSFDPKMEMLDRVFTYIRQQNIPAATFADYAKTLQGA